MRPTIDEINAVRAANDDTTNTETIAAAFRAMTQHVRNTVGVDSDGSSPDLQKVLERYDLLDGSLKTSVDNVGSKSLSAAYDKLIRYMNTHNRVIHSGDVAAIGQLTTTITNTAKAIRPESAEDIQADMDELTGGVKYRDVTADVVAAVMDEDAKRTIIAATLAIPQAIIDPQQQRLNAMSTWLETTDDMTPAALQSYADELLSTTDGNPVGHPSGYDGNPSGG